MDKRLDTSRSGYHEQDTSSHSKKSKKRSSKRNNTFSSWTNNVQPEQNNDMVSGMEYQHVLWQSGMQQNFPNNGQRLFATTSDPSVCNYTPMPMTYTMEPVSLPAMYRLYQPIPVPGIRTIHGRPRRHYSQNHPINVGVNANSMANGYTSLQENGTEFPTHTNYQNGDYASLPPTANKNNGINGDELSSEHRRYSDPGIGSAEAPVHTQSDDSDSVDSGSSITTVGRSNKLVLSLIEQMTELKKNNSQLFKELNETKSELENVKVKMIQCKHSSSSDYQPGMLSDLIHEIREANKTCEETLVAKVKSIVEERLTQKSSEVEKLNSQVSKLTKEKEESDRRIVKLEEEVSTLKLNANNEGREIAAFEEETLALRRELQEARAWRTLAENHAAKCVNAVARSVTPVSFETPCITSTPVRTALSDTCSLIPVVSSSITTPSSNYGSLKRSRSAEVAHHFVPEKSNPYRNAIDCSPRSIETQKDPWIGDLDKNDQSTEVSSMQYKSAVACLDEDCANDHSDATDETLSLLSLDDTTKKENKSKVDERLDNDKNTLIASSVDVDEINETTDKSTSWNSKGSDTVPSKDADENKADSVPRNEKEHMITTAPEERTSSNQEVTNVQSREYENVCFNSRDQRNQRGSIKKPRRKKASAPIKRSYSETDKSAHVSSDFKSSVSSTNNNLPKDVRKTASEDEGGFDDDEKSRAITEIPEVTVVGGGSFVPKDLCSNGILTSRVLTAPSRATYTTAYYYI